MGVGSFGGMYVGMTAIRISTMNSGRRLHGGGGLPPDPKKDEDDDKIATWIKVLLILAVIFPVGLLITFLTILLTR